MASRIAVGRWVQNVQFLSRLALRKPIFLARLGVGMFRAMVLRQKRLRFMDIAVDYACNMRCEHCSATVMMRPPSERLTPSEYEQLARQLRREGCLVFHFTGGEPLLRDDLEDVIRAFKPGRCAISIQTNGLLATEERIAALKRVGLDILCVSIDSGVPEEHDEFRRSPGAFEKALNAVKYAKRLGLRTMVSTCVSHDNIRSEGLRKIIAITEELGVWCYFNLAVPAGNWREQAELLFRPEDRVEMERIFAEHPHCRVDLTSNWLSYGCGAVKEKLYLTAYGEVIPCPFIQIALGDLRREPMSLIRRRALRLPEFKDYAPICLAAEDRDFISKCPCYTHEADRLPVSYKQVEWMAKEMDHCRT